MKILSVMSGSSLDGTDIGVIEISYTDKWIWKIIEAVTVPLANGWKHKLYTAPTLSSKDLLQLNAEYAVYQANEINRFLRQTKLLVDVVSFHGHTIFHDPGNGYSYQLGCCATISALTNLTVIGDYRTADIALGGQGAPLMSIVDELLFDDYLAFVNLGGIANVAVKSQDKMLAFDICPCNQILNFISERSGQDFDKDGKLASVGTYRKKLHEKLLQDHFLIAPFPKSLDNNYIRKQYFSLLAENQFSLEDLSYTCCVFIAEQIANNLKASIEMTSLSDSSTHRALFSGGGSFHPVLVKLLDEQCKLIDVLPIYPEEELINYKELLLMGLLGYLRWNNLENVKSASSGSLRNTISGAIYAT